MRSSRFTVLAAVAIAATASIPVQAQQPSPSPALLSLVGLGDSLPGALGCSSPCRSFVEIYGELAEAALGSPVATTNLATNDGLESGRLLERVQTDPVHRDALAHADLITVMIGLNDWQGQCYWDGMAECLARGTTGVDANLTAILDEIDTLRGGLPTILRVVTYFDPYVGTAQANEWWRFDPAQRAAFEMTFGGALTDFNAMLCRVAEAHDAVCIDTRTPINGPAGDIEALPEPAEGALVLGGEDHLHLTAAGHELVAQTIADTGFAPLTRAPEAA